MIRDYNYLILRTKELLMTETMGVKKASLFTIMRKQRSFYALCKWNADVDLPHMLKYR